MNAGWQETQVLKKLCKWFDKFQKEVDKLTKGIIKFTMEIWKPSNEDLTISKTIKVLGGKSTPYLDADLFFNSKSHFNTRVFFKKGYKIKHVEGSSVRGSEQTSEKNTSSLSDLECVTAGTLI